MTYVEPTHDKPSFVFYNDWIATYYNLPPEMRLALMDMIFAYHLAREKIATEELALKVAFGLIEPAMARDIKTYYESKERRRASGSKGGQVRASNAKQTQAMLSNAKQTQAIQAVNVNVNDNVNVNVNDNVNVNVCDVNITLSRHPSTVEALQRYFKLTTEQLREWGCKFNDFIAIEKKVHKDDQDQLAHFRDWLNIKLKEQTTASKANKPNNDANEAIHRQIMEEQRQERAKRSEGCISYEEYQKTKKQSQCS